MQIKGQSRVKHHMHRSVTLKASAGAHKLECPNASMITTDGMRRAALERAGPSCDALLRLSLLTEQKLNTLAEFHIPDLLRVHL